MRITWLSNAPWATTGYANQTRLFVPRLQEALGHAMSIICFYGLEGGITNWYGIQLYPKGFHPYGQDVVSAHSQEWKADITISLMDAWVCTPEMYHYTTKWVPWFPIDMDPLPPPIARKVEKAYRRIVFSKFGCQMMDQAGLDYDYIPHGVDTHTYRPRDRKELRQMVGAPKDAFIVGMVAANKGTPSRKAFLQQLEGFQIFKRTHPDAVLYLHTTKGVHGEHQGINLPEYIEYIGLRPGLDVIFSPQYELLVGFNDDYMANLFNVFDMLTNVSTGEGFGIPILEAQACGTPVVVGDWTAMSELCFAGAMVPKEGARKMWTPLAAYQWDPEPEAIAEAYSQVYGAVQSDEIALRTAAWQGAAAYDVDLIIQQAWKPTLEAIAESLIVRSASSEESWTPRFVS